MDSDSATYVPPARPPPRHTPLRRSPPTVRCQRTGVGPGFRCPFEADGALASSSSSVPLVVQSSTHQRGPLGAWISSGVSAWSRQPGGCRISLSDDLHARFAATDCLGGLTGKSVERVCVARPVSVNPPTRNYSTGSRERALRTRPRRAAPSSRSPSKDGTAHLELLLLLARCSSAARSGFAAHRAAADRRGCRESNEVKLSEQR